jgi:hypothetical protein
MKIPDSAKAKWIGLIPSLDFKIVAYHTNKAFYVEVVRFGFCIYTVFRSTGNGAFNYHNTNRCVREAFAVAGFDPLYAEDFCRTAPSEFVRGMLNAASPDYIFEGL